MSAKNQTSVTNTQAQNKQDEQSTLLVPTQDIHHDSGEGSASKEDEQSTIQRSNPKAGAKRFLNMSIEDFRQRALAKREASFGNSMQGSEPAEDDRLTPSRSPTQERVHASRAHQKRRHFFDAGHQQTLFKTIRERAVGMQEASLKNSMHGSDSAENGLSTPPRSSTQGQNDLPSVGQQQRQLFDAGKQNLVYTLTRREDRALPKTAVLNLATLQRMTLHQLQTSIALYVGEMYETSRFPLDGDNLMALPRLLHQYCMLVYMCMQVRTTLMTVLGESLRDLDYMEECALRGYDKDPCLLKSSRALDREIMKVVGLIHNHVLPKGDLPMARDTEQPQLLGSSRNRAKRSAFKQKRLLRFAMAASGGLLLVVPMLIMAAVPGKLSSLVTTSVAMLIFATLVTLVTELGPNDVLATTAAYAAVLVVFVGTSLAPQH